MIWVFIAAEKNATQNIQRRFFEAVSADDLEEVQTLTQLKDFNINMTDSMGNTGLHLAANQDQTKLAVFLIQKGASTTATNSAKLSPLDLAKSKEMREILGYVPAASWRNYEGFLLKKRKFLGYKEYYVLLRKGSILYYSSKLVEHFFFLTIFNDGQLN